MFHKITVFFMLCLLAQMRLGAQTFLLNGNVSTLTYEPLELASVQIKGSTDTSLLTDAKGAFAVLLPNGNYTLQISYVGYQLYQQKVVLSANLPLNIRLLPATVALNVVEISATRAPQGINGSNSNVSKAQLDRQNNGQDLPFLLQLTPSAVVTSDAGAGVGYTGIRLRGSDATRINATINDMPLNDPESHQVYWVNLPDISASTDNIEIQRGIGSSTNGAGAFGGSINIQTLKRNAVAYTQLSNSYGSFNTQRHSVGMGTGMLNKYFTLDARLSYIASDGYIDRASSNLKSYFLAGNYYGNRHSLRLLAFGGHEITYQAWEGVPAEIIDTNRTYNPYTYDNQVDDYRQNHYQLHYGYQLASRLTLKLGLHYTKGSGFYEQYQTNQNLASYGLNNTTAYNIANGDTTLITNTDLVRRKWLDNDFYGTTYALLFKPQKGEFMLGGALNQYDGKHFGEIIWAQFAANSQIRQPYYNSKGLKTDGTIFVKMSYPIAQKLNAFADVQYRQINYQIAGNDDGQDSLALDLNYHFFNPKAGINYTLNTNNQVSASFGIGNREPTRSNIIDNATPPKPEHLADLELNYTYTNNAKHTLALTAYYMHYKNQLVLTGNLNNVGTPIQQNVANSYRTGIELNGATQLHRKLRFEGNVALSQNKIASFEQTTSIYSNNWDWLADTTLMYKNVAISFSPQVVAAAVLTYQPFKGIELALNSKYVGKQYLDNTQNPNRTLNAYWVNNVQMSYTRKTKWCKEIGFNVQLNNLLNTLYEANGWTYFVLFNENNAIRPTNYNNYYPQAGFNFLAGLTLKW
jgi:iron complex outermembrane receptor protein